MSGSPALARAREVAQLTAFPRVELARWPTPVEEAPLAGGETVLVKRDDLCGHGRGGAKARKIEHVLGWMLSRGYGESILVAGNVTNLAFDLLPALDRCGLRCSLVIADDPPASPRERAAIFAGIRERVELVRGRRLTAAWRSLLRWRQSSREGHRPLLLLPGLSHPAAVVGSACGMLELAEQRMAAGAPLPATVFITVATGTTLAGLLLGAEALRRAGVADVQVRGVAVRRGASTLCVLGLLRWTERVLGWSRGVLPRHLRIEPAVEAFGVFPSAVAACCERVAARTGLHLDPIFGGKTWTAMEEAVNGGHALGPVLYWHCGFTPEWRTLGRAVGGVPEAA